MKSTASRRVIPAEAPSDTGEDFTKPSLPHIRKPWARQILPTEAPAHFLPDKAAAEALSYFEFNSSLTPR